MGQAFDFSQLSRNQVPVPMIFTAPAYVHPQYSYWKLKRRASVLYTRIWKIQNKQTRRSTTVHVYTWACRLMVFLQGFPEPECRDVGTTAHVSCLYQTALRKFIEIFA